MKKSNRYLIPIFILIVGLSLFVEKQAQQVVVEKEKIDISQTDFLGEPVEQKTAPVIVKSAAAAPTQVIKLTNLEKCANFIKGDLGENPTQPAKILSVIKEQYSIKNEIIDLTEYQLQTPTNEELIVQHIPKEEIKNQVRIFKTGADGFPDRIKEFPNSGANEELRLEGALTMGSLIKKIEKYKVVNSDRTILAYEKTNDEVTKVDFTNGRNQMICEDQQCSCHEF